MFRSPFAFQNGLCCVGQPYSLSSFLHTLDLHHLENVFWHTYFVVKVFRLEHGFFPKNKFIYFRTYYHFHNSTEPE